MQLSQETHTDVYVSIFLKGNHRAPSIGISIEKGIHRNILKRAKNDTPISL